MYPRTGRLENGCHGNTTGVGQTLVVNHLLTKRNNETNTHKGTGNGTECHQYRVEVHTIAKNENCRNGKHQTTGGAVDAAGNGLHDIVLNDGVAPQHTAQNRKTQDGSEFGTFDGKPQYQCRVTDTDRNDRTKKITDKNSRNCQLGVGAGANHARCFTRCIHIICSLGNLFLKTICPN